MITTQKTFIKNRHGLKISVLIEKPENAQGLAFIAHPFTGFKEGINITALAYAPEMQIPLLIVVGSQDESCPADQQKQLFDAWGTAEKELKIVDGAPHGFGQPEHAEALKIHFDNWLKKVI